MQNSEFIIIFITCSSKEEAKKIKDILLQNKKVACVNIIPKIDSFFWWQGKVDSANEVLLIAKTTNKMSEDIIALVKKHHSYDVPEIIALPIVNGNKEYLDWIKNSIANN